MIKYKFLFLIKKKLTLFVDEKAAEMLIKNYWFHGKIHRRTRSLLKRKKKLTKRAEKQNNIKTELRSNFSCIKILFLSNE